MALLTRKVAAVFNGLIASRTRRKLRDNAAAYAFVGLAVILYVVFVLRPTAEVLVLSLYRWDGISPVRDWVGVENFRKLLMDPIFWQALQHNLVWLVLIVFFNVSVGLVTASLLSMNIKSRFVFRLGYFLPVIQASIVIALIWRWIYNPDGVLNRGLEAVGLGSLAQGWLGEPALALPALALAAGWAGFGLAVVIFLAAMQGVDQTLYDAARVDGANARQLFHHITIPALRKVITVVILLEMIGAFQTFDIIWATTQGGPLRATEMLATYMFKRGIQEGQYGYGAAVAVVFMVIVLVFAGVSVALRERGED